MQIGLALGSGSARGWAHIGIIRALDELGIHPAIICGTSIGSLVGASHVSGKLARLEEWVSALSKLETARFFEISTRLDGFVNRDKFQEFLQIYVAEPEALIEAQAVQYAAIATDMESGREIWMNKGSLLDAVWASISLPGLFPAIQHRNRWLIDGALVNPVPVSVCRALGADIVIAVNLNNEGLGRPLKKAIDDEIPEPAANSSSSMVDRVTGWMKDYAAAVFPAKKTPAQPPSVFEAIACSVHITQDRITRSRLAGEPPDIVLSPKLADIGLLEFYRGQEVISEGYDCVRRQLPEIEYMLGLV